MPVWPAPPASCLADRRRPGDRQLRLPEREQAHPAAARGVRGVARAPSARAARARRPGGARPRARAPRSPRSGSTTRSSATATSTRSGSGRCSPPATSPSRSAGRRWARPRPARSACSRSRKPLIVSDVDAFRELPDDVVLKVAPDEREVETLAAALLAARRPGSARASERGGPRLRRARARARPRRRPLRCRARGGRRRPRRPRGAAPRGRAGRGRRGAGRPGPRRRGAPRGRPWPLGPRPARPRARSSAPFPVWAWLTAIVAVSAVARFVFAIRIEAPWIMVDELIYSELAKGLAAGDGFSIRGVADERVRVRLPAADRAGVRALPLAAAGVRGGRRRSTPSSSRLPRSRRTSSRGACCRRGSRCSPQSLRSRSRRSRTPGR